MQVFKLYFKILKSPSLALIIYAIVFAGIITLMTVGQTKEKEKYEETKVDTALINFDSDNAFVQNFLIYLSNYCNIIEFDGNENDLTDALIFRKAEYVLTIPYSFGEDFLKGKEVFLEKKTIPGGLYETAIDRAVNRYMSTSKTYLSINPKLSLKELITYVNHDLNIETAVSINYNHEGRDYSFYNKYFNLSSYILLACSFLGVGMVMLTFYNVDIRRRNLVAPLKFKNIDFQLIAGNIIFILVCDVFFIIIGTLINRDKHFDFTVLLFWVNLIVFSFSALGISFLSAILVKRKEINEMLSYILPLGLSFISGAFIPQSLLGEEILKLSQFFPLYWFIKANNAISMLPVNSVEKMSEIFILIAIQFGFSMAIFSLALVAGKYRQQTN